MTNQETRAAIELLNTGGPWGHKPMEPSAARYYGAELSQYEFGPVMAALRALGRTSKWRPSLAEILEILAPDNSEQASAAFASVMAAFIHPPGTRGAKISKAAQEAVRRLGGWGVIGVWKHENMGIHQSAFERVFRESTVDIERGGGFALPSGRVLGVLGGAK